MDECRIKRTNLVTADTKNLDQLLLELADAQEVHLDECTLERDKRLDNYFGRTNSIE